jgi:hypothetical protein
MQPCDGLQNGETSEEVRRVQEPLLENRARATVPTKEIVCAHCGNRAQKSVKEINRASRRGKRVFCSRSCAALLGVSEKRLAYVMPTEKTCITCGTRKPLNSYGKRTNNLDGRFGECRECRSKRGLTWRERNPEKARAIALKTRYGLTPDLEAEILAKQGGVCALCREDRPLVVDHCHKTGVVRGLLCNRCNCGLGHLGDTAEGLEKALAYVSACAGKK